MQHSTLTSQFKLMLVTLFIFSISLSSTAQKSDQIWAYINKFKDIALEEERQYGMPASITLAQGILESGAGRSGLTRKSHNHFGIKAGSKWKGPVHKAWDDDPYISSFRKYRSDEESYRDHTLFLKNHRNFGKLFHELSVYDYRGWAYGLKKYGYATAPRYAESLIGYIECYRLYEINGGRKLRGGQTKVISRIITWEEFVKRTDIIIEDSVETEEEVEVKNVTQKNNYHVEINGVDCTVLYPGESLSNIARNYNIPKQKLLEYNEIANEDDIHEGDIVFLAKKKNKFKGSQDYYNVKKGDTLYLIAQQFGVTLAYLSKINGINLFDQLKEGERLRLK